MFERFTDRARVAVMGGQSQALRLRHTYTGTEHMLLALGEGDSVAARALDQAGFDRSRFEQAVLAEVSPSQVVNAGDIPFTPRLKQALARSLRQSMAMGHDYIGTEHIVLGLLEDNTSLATKLVAEQGISASTVRDKVIDLLTIAAQGTSGPGPTTTPAAPATATAGPAPAGTSWDETTKGLLTPPGSGSAAAGPRCPGCSEPLAPNLAAEMMASVGEVERPFTVTYCRACGHFLAIFPDG
jgi:ATP-dependent Clp protease ATP-binding subunit ClpC